MPKEPNPATMLAAILAQEHFAAQSLNPQFHVAPYVAARDAESLVRIGNRLNRLAVDQCNRPWDDSDYAKAEKARAKAAKDAGAILDRYGATVDCVNNDPRGFGLTFRLASGRGNSFGDSGIWGV